MYFGRTLFFFFVIQWCRCKSENNLNVTCEFCEHKGEYTNTSRPWLKTITYRYLKSSRMSSDIYYLLHDNILESVVDLMLYWERYDQGCFLLEKHLLGYGADVTQKYLKYRLRTFEVYFIESYNDIDMFLHGVQFTYVNIISICGNKTMNNIIQKGHKMDLFSTNHTWIFYTQDRVLPEKLANVDITPESQVTLIRPHTDQTISDIDIFDVFYSTQTNSTEMVKFAKWNEISGLFLLETFDANDQQRKLKGRRVRTVVFQHPPYTMLRNVRGELTVTGYLKDMFDMLMESANIRYSIREVEEVFGIGINGTFTGFVGILFRREAEMAINALAMTNSRRAGIRYIGPAMKASLAIMSNKPESIIPPGTYLMPFDGMVWISTFILLLIIIILLAVVNYREHHTSSAYVTSKLASIDKRRQSILLWLTTFQFFVEVSENPVSCSSKVIYGTLMVTSVAVCAHYTSVFTSFLAYHEEKVPFNDLKDVAMSKDYTILVVRNTRHHDILQYAQTGVYVDVWQRIVLQGDKSFVRNFETGVEQTYSGKYVFLSDGPTLMFLSAENCSVSFAPKVYTREHWCMSSRRDFPYSRIFTRLLMKLMEGGILNRLSIVYKADRRPACTNSNPNDSFGLSQVVGVFLVWQAGVLISIISLFIERKLYKMKYFKFCEKKLPTSKISDQQ